MRQEQKARPNVQDVANPLPGRAGGLTPGLFLFPFVFFVSFEVTLLHSSPVREVREGRPSVCRGYSSVLIRSRREYIGNNSESIGDPCEYIGSNSEYIRDPSEYTGSRSESIGSRSVYIRSRCE
jgi:hypothetical protein